MVITHFSIAPEPGISKSDVFISIQNARSAAVKARDGASEASIAAHKAFLSARNASTAARVLLQKAIFLVNTLEVAQEEYDTLARESMPATRT